MWKNVLSKIKKVVSYHLQSIKVNYENQKSCKNKLVIFIVFKNNIHHVTKHIAIFRYGKLDICMCNFLLFIRCYLVFLQTIVLRKLYPICSMCISMLYLHLFIDNELRYRVLLLMSRETHWSWRACFISNRWIGKKNPPFQITTIMQI